MNYRVKQAIESWDSEVDSEFVRLIESGVPPYAAAEQVGKNVSNRRKVAAGENNRKKSE